MGWTITSSGSSASTRSYLFLNEEFFTLVFVHFLLPFLCCKIIWSSESESSDLTHLLLLGLKIKTVSLNLEFYAMLLTKSNHQYPNYKSWSFMTFLPLRLFATKNTLTNQQTLVGKFLSIGLKSHKIWICCFRILCWIWWARHYIAYLLLQNQYVFSDFF